MLRDIGAARVSPAVAKSSLWPNLELVSDLGVYPLGHCFSGFYSKPVQIVSVGVLVLFVPFVNDLCDPASCSHRLERDNIVLSEIVCEAQMLFLRRSWELKHQLPAVSQVNCKLASTLLIWRKIVASVVTIDCTRLK